MSLRVLLADESASIRKVFQMGLQDYGAEVKSVHNGLDVIEVAQNYEPHIIFADILLQKKNGYEVAKEIGAHPSLNLTPVVLMWSSFMELDQGKYKACGAKAELEKPFDIDKMRNLIRDLVETTKSQMLSDFLQFPKNITSEFVEEEKQKEAGGGEAPPQAPAAFEPSSFDLDESDEGMDLALEGETPAPPEFEATSEFNIKADDHEPEEFNMYEVPPPPGPETQEQSLSVTETDDKDNWEAKPLSKNINKDETQDYTQEDDLDQFKSMDLGDEKKLNLDDFLYKPEASSVSVEKNMTESDATTRTGEIHNVNVPNYDNRTQPMGQGGMNPAEMEAIIRQEVRIAMGKVIQDQLPGILERVVRDELEKILQQEMALKGAEQSP